MTASAYRRAGAGTMTRLVTTTALLAVSSVLFTAPSPAVTAAPSYDPVPGATTFAGSVYTQVAADGRGAFHMVSREVGLQQSIVYRTSTDGGRTWVVAGRFTGEGGGATRPQLAVDDGVVAIGFIGGYCSAPGLCGEAPYLVLATNRGLRIRGPIRTAGNARNVAVAVDGPTVWFAHDGLTAGGGSIVSIRAFDSAGGTVLRSAEAAGYSPRLAAGDGAGVLTFVREVVDPVQGRLLVPTARFLRGTAFAGATELATVPVGLAAADGRVHLLFGQGPVTTANYTVRTSSVGAGPGDATLGPPVAAITGTGGSIAARRGLVTVAAVDPTTGVTSVVRSDDGDSFSSPVAVASSTRRPYATSVAVATRADDGPLVRIDWKVPPRYVDRNGDGIPDPANDLLPTRLSDVTVELDACTSLPGEDASIASYRWRVDGTPLPDTTCTASISVPNGSLHRVTVVVTDSAGRIADRTIEVAPRDLLVVSIGDSVASGEGNPHLPATDQLDPFSETWELDVCHRSHFAGPALAARRLEDADERTSVTFVQLACSGAAVMDVPPTAGAAPSGPDDPDTGGLLDGYRGVEPGAAPAQRPQLAEMDLLVRDRTPDAVMVSIGANDVKFSEVVHRCLLGWCTNDSTATELDARLATLPTRYAMLAEALTSRGVPADAVHISEYFDVATDDLGLANLRCVADETTATGLTGFALVVSGLAALYRLAIEAVLDGSGVISDDEAAWADEYVLANLNQAVRAGADAHGWRYVGGIADEFERHGYCASEPYVVGIVESFRTQADPFGAFHPNRAGHEVYGRRLGRSLVNALVEPSLAEPTAPPTQPVIGDVYVATSGYEDVTVAAAYDTGDTVDPITQRRLDRVALGDGMVGHAGAPAADPATAVAAWYQLDGPGISAYRSLAARVGIAENLAVRSAEVVQAPSGASRLVAGRTATALAAVDATLAEAGSFVVHVTVTDDLGRVVESSSQDTYLHPGTNQVTSPGFTPEDGRSYRAEVTVAEPSSLLGAVPGDNTATSADFADGAPTTARSRNLSVLAIAADVGPDSLTCADVRQRLGYRVNYAEQAMPVTGVDWTVACWSPDDREDAAASPEGVLRQLTYLDYVARMTGRDVAVAVTPPGWLTTAKPGTLGIAQMGGRGAIIDAGASTVVLAHELTHNFGGPHVDDVPTSGVALIPDIGFTSTVGSPYMQKYDDGGSRPDPVTWDQLAESLDPPSTVPAPPDPAAGGVWVRGTVFQDAEGKWQMTLGRWVPADPATAGDLGDDAVLEVERLTARQVDAGGQEVASDPIPLGDIDAVFAPGAEPTGPVGLGFSTPIAIDPAAAAIELVLDGVVVERRVVNAAPSVTLTAPAARAEATRGDALEIAWTASDPDGDPLVFDLFASDDGGTSWEPLALDLTASPATITVPASLDGDDVLIRVAASDGVRTAFADSEPFSVGGAIVEVADQVVFTRLPPPNYGDNGTLHVMAPDGGGEVAIPLPTTHTWETSGISGYVCSYDCIPAYEYPAWSADGTRVLFTSDLVDTRFGGAAIPGVKDRTVEHLWSAAPDGTDLRRITQPDTEALPIGEVSPFPTYNRCVDAVGDRLAWLGIGGLSPNAIWSAGADGSGRIATFRSFTLSPDPATWPARLGTGWNPAATAFTVNLSSTKQEDAWRQTSCPRLSPDGTSVAFTAVVDESPYTIVNGYAISTWAVVVADVDGSNARIVTNKLEDHLSVDWIDGDTLVVMRRRYPAWYQPGSPVSSLDITYEPRALELSTLASSSLAPPRNVFDAFGAARVAPDGRFYGMRASLTRGESDLAVIDGSGAVSTVVKAGTRDLMFDWERVTTTTGTDVPHVGPPEPVVEPEIGTGGPYVVSVDEPITLSATGTAIASGATGIVWDLDDDGAFDDAEGPNPTVSFATAGTHPLRVRATSGSGSTITSQPGSVQVLAPDPPAFEVAPGADETVVAPPLAIPVRIEIPAGVTTAVRLGPPDGPAGTFAVVEHDAGVLTVTSGPGAGPTLPLPATGPEGTVLVTPDPAFRGTTTFRYAPIDDPAASALVEVTVTGNAAPVAGTDDVTVTVGSETDVPVATLLANDVDPDGTAAAAVRSAEAAPALRIVSVRGMANGQAWLDPNGTSVVVLAALPGTASFEYLVADAEGGLGVGVVRVSIQAVPTSSTTTSTVAPSTTSTTVPPSTTTTISGPSTTEPPQATTTAPPPASPPTSGVATTTLYGGRLPGTGGEPNRTVVVALLVLVTGLAVTHLTRRRRSTS